MRRQLHPLHSISPGSRIFVFFCLLLSACAAQVAGIPADEHLEVASKPFRTQQQVLSDLIAAREKFQSHPSAEASLQLGLALKEAGETAAASKLLDEAVELNPRLSQAWYAKGLIAADQGDWSRAADCFRHTLAISAENTSAHLALGEMLLRMGDFSRAEAQLRSALQLDSRSAGAHQGLGLINLQEGRADEAGQEFRAALAIRPDYVDAKTGLARVLADQHRWAEAADLLKQIVAVTPNSIEERSSLGTALSNLGDKAGAAEQFSRAEKLSNKQVIRLRAEGERNWGISLRNEGKLQEASAAFRRALSEDSSYCDAHDDLGEVLWMQKNFADALSEFQTAVGCGPDSASARNNLGSALLYYQHDVDGAIVQLRAATTGRPGFALAHFNLGKAFAAKQEYASAEPEFRAAVAIDPTMAAAHLNLGIVLAMKDNRLSKEARAEIQSGLRLDPRLRDFVPQQYLAELHQ
jgi:tetratricopeptide (TPR) repeat protein